VKSRDKQLEVSFTPKERKDLQQAVLQWVESKEFDDYFTTLHLPPYAVPLGCLALAATIVGVVRIPAFVTAVRRQGRATPALRRGYLELARTGQVVWAQVVKAGGLVKRGTLSSGPAIAVAAAEGTAQSDKQLTETFYKLLNTLRATPPGPVAAELRALLDLDSFELFRVRRLPPHFAGNLPVYVFDMTVHQSSTPNPTFDPKGSASLLCIVNPNIRPAILAIPYEMAFRVVPNPRTRILVDRSLRAH